MRSSLVFSIVALLALAAFALGRRRALAVVGGRSRELHSLPGYYGWYAALWCGVPGLAVALAWVVFASAALDRMTLDARPDALRRWRERAGSLPERREEHGGRPRRRAPTPAVEAAAERYTSMRQRGLFSATALAMLLSLAGGALALRRVAPGFAARVAVERALRRGCCCSRPPSRSS